jgi:hypothetical protein
MPKSKKQVSKKTGTLKRNKSIHDATFHGIIVWYENSFKQLGWMVLAQKFGYNDKISSYVNSVHRLKKAIQEKITHRLVISDRKEDLSIMLKNLEVLIEHINKDFGKVGGGYTSSNNGSFPASGLQGNLQTINPLSASPYPYGTITY